VTTGEKIEHGPASWIRGAYERMEAFFGDLHWWPAETPLEVMVGAILTQNTAWPNVRKAVERLKTAGCLSAAAIAALPQEALAELIRPSGYYNVKARRLKAFMTWFLEAYGGDEEAMFREETQVLRERLLKVKGIGDETADSILLYAGGKPVFVVDAYTRRILSRHGLVDGKVSYGDLQDLFMEHLPPSAPLYNQYHALIVETGKRFCRKKPRCASCPLGGPEGTALPQRSFLSSSTKTS